MAATCTVCELHAESTFRIEGMDCREEVAMLERRFRNLRGLEHFHADLMGQRLHVQYDASKLTASAIAGAVADTGMRAWLEHEAPSASPDAATRRRQVLLASAAAWYVGASIFSHADAAAPGVNACYAASLLSSLPLTARRAWVALRHRSLDINVLMLIAAAGAITLGDWAEAAAVVGLFAVAQMLEAYTLDRARQAVRALLDLAPNEVILRTGSGERRMPVDQAAAGDVIVIRPGDKFPLDGLVVEGTSAVNQAPITGESLPVDKAPGDEVFAGSINGRGALDIRVTRLRRDTRLARITHLVEQAQAQRAPAQAFIERFAATYTPLVIALALAVATVPPLALRAAWSEWTYRALVLLVVSCPCALVISTPVSVVAALAGAARKGVLIKGGIHLERAAAITCVAFDKTGTLTHGAPVVTAVHPVTSATRDTILGLAAAVELRSEHPIASAIVSHARQLAVDIPGSQAVTALTGLGVEGVVDGRPVLLGNHRLMDERDLCHPSLHARVEALAADGHTAVLVAHEREVIGVITVSDTPREASRDALALLREHGVAHVAMLTGDAHGTARAIGAMVGVDDVRAELMPEDKVSAIHDLRQRHGVVAMVGDGVNDAPALATADLGIAMGAAGSEAALETADIALMADELQKLPYAIRLSRATMANIRMNLGIALVLKAAFLLAAVTGGATLWMAVLADTGASVIVVANALRLLRAD